MSIAGMITEYDPLHLGHVYLVEETRRLLGAESAVIAVMSGDFVQRGAFASVRRQARARAAVESGVDLVLELPLPWAVSSAEGFAKGAVGLLAATGLVDFLVFGSECGDGEALRNTAAVLAGEEFPAALRGELATGVSFPAARQRAAEKLGAPAGILSRPNDSLAVEYCKAILLSDSDIRPVAVLRRGAGHGEERSREGELPSASAIRALLREGERERALSLMAPAMRERWLEEEAAGRAPVFQETLERAVLARLRSMAREDFAALDGGREGLSNRLYKASREAASLEGVLDAAKTKRYPRARLRRMVLRAFLGLADTPDAPPYLRPLAMNETGRGLLARMRRRASLPVLTRPADVRALGAEAQALFAREAGAAGLYALAYPDLAAAGGGALWREGPWVRPPPERSDL